MIDFVNGIPMKNGEFAVRTVDLMLLNGTYLKVEYGNSITNLIMKDCDGIITPTEALSKIRGLMADLGVYEEFFKSMSKVTIEDITSLGERLGLS